MRQLVVCVGGRRDGMAATIIRAIDQDAAHAHLAHFAEVLDVVLIAILIFAPSLVLMWRIKGRTAQAHLWVVPGPSATAPKNQGGSQLALREQSKASLVIARQFFGSSRQ